MWGGFYEMDQRFFQIIADYSNQGLSVHDLAFAGTEQMPV
jgi:hypothetical protein